MLKPLLSTASLLLLTTTICAQPDHAHQHHHAQMAQQHNQYSGLQTRDIKALSQEQIDGLLAGKGMSLAITAELNGYPGPMHTLELADALQLTDEQKTYIQALYEVMRDEAQQLGALVIEAERNLDLLFKNNLVNEENLLAATLAVGEAQALLRALHLRYHLSTVDVLSKTQIDNYNRLRGYHE
jgi:hypothetical protein